jgi:hypothetical protein
MLKTLREKVVQHTGLTGFSGLVKGEARSAHLKAKNGHFDKKTKTTGCLYLHTELTAKK